MTVTRLDNLFVQAMKTGAWRTYVLLWFGITLAVAAASFLLFLIPGVSWEALAPYYVSFAKGTPVISMTWAKFMGALQISELEALINGVITFCAAPLLMSAQFFMGDYDRAPAPVPA